MWVGADVIVTISLYTAKKLNKYITEVQLCAKVTALMKLSGKLRQESSFCIIFWTWNKNKSCPVSKAKTIKNQNKNKDLYITWLIVKFGKKESERKQIVHNKTTNGRLVRRRCHHHQKYLHTNIFVQYEQWRRKTYMDIHIGCFRMHVPFIEIENGHRCVAESPCYRHRTKRWHLTPTNNNNVDYYVTNETNANPWLCNPVSHVEACRLPANTL